MTMTMRPSSTARLLAAAALALSCLVGGARATVVTTCRAAADSVARVDYGFCVAELGKHRESPDADTWGLAKVAALTGIVNADDAVYDIGAMLAKPGRADAPTRAALGQCQKLYNALGFAFAEAYDQINNRDYAAGKGKAAEVVALTHKCDDVLAKAGAVPSPLAQRSSYSVQIAIICTAITNLIK
ncbi:pectinesterase inhibitor 8-like [Phragmites australis]|uniref:pectinesterase inhibitor 8-like n=1 Tax=Phragmites australis TaxID=29695 RepID=UPI002D79A879|nr:pectinesterase inhibitor 8-like [Phragmites australis]